MLKHKKPLENHIKASTKHKIEKLLVKKQCLYLHCKLLIQSRGTYLKKSDAIPQADYEIITFWGEWSILLNIDKIIQTVEKKNIDSVKLAAKLKIHHLH